MVSRCQLARSMIQNGEQVSISAFHAAEFGPGVNSMLQSGVQVSISAFSAAEWGPGVN